MHLLVVEDDPRLSRLLKRLLEEDRHVVELAGDGASALEVAESTTGIELAILDVGLPDITGIEVARRLRRNGSEIAILMLTARDTVGDRVAGLDAGADDYLVKPYGFRELLARLRAVQRRMARPGQQTAGRHLARFDHWTVDLAAHRAMHEDGWHIGMTSGELSLLRAFLDNPNRVLYRHELLSLTRRDDAAVFDRTIDVLVSRLRRKLELDPSSPQLIQTVRGEGYLFTQPVDWSVT